MQFGRRLAEIRRRQGVTQEELAAGVGLSVRTIAAIEGGDSGPRFDLLERIADYLAARPRELFEFPEA